MTTVEILRAARVLIADPQRWIQGAEALPSRDADPLLYDLDATDERAECWCVGGAITRVAPSNFDARIACNSFAKAAGVKYAYLFNDAPDRVHADILAMLDRAIVAEGTGS